MSLTHGRPAIPGPAERARANAQGHLAMLSFSALVAGSFSLGGMVANDIAPVAFNALRFWLAAALVGLLAWHHGSLRRAAFVAPWRYLLLGAVFGLYFVLMFEGLKTAPPVSAAAVFTLVPLMSAGVAWVLLRQVMTPRMALALTIGAVGALWVIFRADLAALLAFDIGAGEAIYFVGCVAHAVYTPLVRRLNRGEGPVVFAFGTLLAGGVVLTFAGLPELRATEFTTLPLRVWVALGYVAVCATSVTVVLLAFATLRLPSAKVMAYTYLTPSWVIVWEVALGNPVPPLLVLGGVMLTVVALLLLLRDEEAVPT